MKVWRFLKDVWIVVRVLAQSAREIADQYAEQNAEYEKLDRMLKELEEKKP